MSDINDIEDKMVRKLLFLEKNRDLPFSVYDETILLDILKEMANRIICLENELTNVRKLRLVKEANKIS